MKKPSKESLQFCAALAIVIFGLILITVAFIVPPTGVIDPSVLAAFGEILTFAGCMLGMDYHYKAKFTAHSGSTPSTELRNQGSPTEDHTT